MTNEQLRTELISGPLASELAPLIEVRADAEIASLLNACTISGRRWVAANDLRDTLMNLGVWYRLRLVVLDTENSAALRAAAQFVIDAAETSDRLRNLDGAAATMLFDTCEQAGILVDGDRAAILALGDTLVSRAEQLDGPGAMITTEQVSQVLNEEASDGE